MPEPASGVSGGVQALCRAGGAEVTLTNVWREDPKGRVCALGTPKDSPTTGVCRAVGVGASAARTEGSVTLGRSVACFPLSPCPTPCPLPVHLALDYAHGSAPSLN